jgi:hypothetical protein
MGAKTWMLVYADSSAREALQASPQLDRVATARLAAALFPGEQLTPLDDGDLNFTNPPDNEICIGCFPGVSIVAAKEFALDYPSRLPARFLAAGRGKTITLHAMHSVVDWFGYAQWVNGHLLRALSLSPDDGILEDTGQRMPFEEPYWAGEHPLELEPDEKPYPLAFHPLDLAEAALEALFGYTLEGPPSDTVVDPDTIRLARYKRQRWRGYLTRLLGTRGR